MKADGTIIVDTEIKTEGVEVGCEDIKNAVKKTSARVKDYGNSVQEWIDNYVKQMDTASSSTNKFKKKIETLSSELETLEKKGLYFGDEIFDSTYVDLQKANEELKNYKKQLVKPIEIPVEISPDSLQGQVDSLKSQLSTLGQQGLTFGDAEYDKTALALKRAEQALAEYKNELFKTEEQVAKEKAQQEALNQKLEETRQKEAAAAAEAARLSESGRNARVSNVYVVKLREEIERLQARQKDLENAGLGPGYAEYDKNAARLKK